VIDVGELRRCLRENADRRARAENEIEAARRELDELIEAAVRSPITTSEVAFLGRVSRETVYRSLRRRHVREGL
jgi:transcriptional regulator of acetoin/glycerol metabolism